MGGSGAARGRNRQGTCRLCAAAAALVDSHVFPEFFYEKTYDETHTFVSVTTHPHHAPRDTQRGLTERLLCARCDGQIGKYESYAATLLRRADAAAEGTKGGPILGGVDFTTLRLFGLSLLWRAHRCPRALLRPRRPRPARGEAPGNATPRGPRCAPRVRLCAWEGHWPRDARRSAARPGARPVRWAPRLPLHGARRYVWVFVVSTAGARLQRHFPFVGSTPDLYLPFLPHDREKLFAQLRRVFLNALGRG